MKMKIYLIALCVLFGVGIQSESFEKRALSVLHRTPASSLDAKLPDTPFDAWLTDTVGQDAGVVWQLAECGAGSAGGSEQDPMACAEATVLLPNGDKMVLGISVGTFKKGLVGDPVFRGAVIDSGEKLYKVRKLSDLPMALRSPKSMSQILPDLPDDPQQLDIRPLTKYPPAAAPGPGANATPNLATEEPAPPPPPSSQQNIVDLVEAVAIKKVKPMYPPQARTMRISGKVEVRVIISETGRVIDATAISGHSTLRKAAEAAALQWVYKPATRNGLPVKTEAVVPFTFAPGDQ